MIKERIIIGRSVGSEYGVGEAPFFVVPIDHRLARLVVEMIDKFAEGGPYYGLAFAEMWSADVRFMSTLKHVLKDGDLDATGSDLFAAFGDVAGFTREELLCSPHYLTTSTRSLDWCTPRPT
jgi:molybdopterin converting factor small subunit